MICATVINKGTLGGGGPTPGAPVAGFTLSESDPIMGDTIQLTDFSTGAPTSWQWFLNGRLFSIMQNPQLYCGAVGAYVVTLTATNAFGSNTTSPGSTVTVHGGQP